MLASATEKSNDISDTISVLLVTDFPILRNALQSIFAATEDLRLMGCIETRDEIPLRASEIRADVVIVDASFISDSLQSVIRGIVQQNSKVLLMGGEGDNGRIIEALLRGASGVISRKSTPELICRSVRAVASGEVWVSRQLIYELIEIIRSNAVQMRRVNDQVERMLVRERPQKE